MAGLYQPSRQRVDAAVVQALGNPYNVPRLGRHREAAGKSLELKARDAMLEHMGIRWGYVFLHGAAYLDGEEIKDLMVQAVEMYLAGDEEREVKGAGFEGKLYTERKYEVIGALGGQRFDAKLETPKGEDQAAFLVSEQSRGMGSFISRN